MKHYLFLLVLVAGLSACDQKGTIEGAKERARAEEEARMETAKERAKQEEAARMESAKERSKLEEEASRDVNLNTHAEKASKMETELASRHRYYNALEGDYEGSLLVGTDEYKIKFTLARSLPPYVGSRVRELSEIENDLNNLYFHMQVVQWHPADQASAVGCRISGLRPNLVNGSLLAASPECPNLYTVLISEGGNQSFAQKDSKAKNLAKKINTLKTNQVNYLVGTVQPSSNAAKYSFTAKRIE
jgi:hypothetical protein